LRSGGAGELGLTEAQSLLLASHPEDHYLLAVAGATYDAGHPAGYAARAAVRAG